MKALIAFVFSVLLSEGAAAQSISPVACPRTGCTFSGSVTVLGNMTINTVTMPAQAQALFFASPPATSGAPGFRSLVSSDVVSAMGFTPYNATNPSNYIAGNQTISLSGDATGSGATSISLTLAAVNTSGAGSFSNITVDAKGRITAIRTISGADVTTALGYTPVNPASATITGGTINGTSIGATTPSTGNFATLKIGGVNVPAASREHISFQPGLLSSVISTKSVFYKFTGYSAIVDNIEGSAMVLSCVTQPTITVYECGTSASCATPTTIGTVTITATGQVFDGSITSSAIGSGDYVAAAVTAGVCTSMDISLTAQVHSN